MIKKLASILLLWSFAANAGLPPTTIQGQSDTAPKTKFSFQVPFSQFTDLGGIKALIETGNTNGLINASFENVAPATGWTAGSNVSSAVNTSSYVDGKQSLNLTASANTGGAQVIWYQDWTPGSALYGNNGEASLYVNTIGSTLQVCPRVQGTTLTNQCVSVPGTGNWVKTSTNFVFPSSGSVGVALYSTAAYLSGTAIGSIDKGYVGLATNPAQVSQAQFIGSAYFPTTASCSWSRTNTAIGPFTSTAACPGPTVEFNPGQGTIQTTDTDLPKVTVTNLAPGYCKATFQHRVDTSSTGVIDFRISDGTTTSGGAGSSPNTTTAGAQTTVGWFNYTTAGDRTFELQASASTGSVTVNNSSGNNRTWFSLECYPAQTQTGYRPDQTPASWSGYQNGWTGSSSVCATSSTTYQDTSACTGITLNPITSRNITCTQTSGSLPGIDCSLPRSGTFNVCAQYQQTPYTGTQRIAARLMAGSTIMNPGLEINPSAASMFFPTTICGKYVATASGTTTFKLQLANSANQTGLVVPSTSGSAGIVWTVDEGDAPQAAPYLMGSVTCDSAGACPTNSATVSCSPSTCAISSQTGAWLSSVSYNSAGTYTLNITSGKYSATPTCSFTGVDTGTGYRVVMGRNSGSWSSTSIQIQELNSSATATDGAFMVTCQGPR
jgi:hypothetical protein